MSSSESESSFGAIRSTSVDIVFGPNSMFLKNGYNSNAAVTI